MLGSQPTTVQARHGAAGSFPADVVAQIPSLRAYAGSLTRSSADADDLVQDTLVRIWRYRSGFAPGSSLRAWMFAVLRNEFFRTRRRRRVLLEHLDERASDPPCEPAQEWNLQWREFLQALQALPERQRQALTAVILWGCTYAQAAQICGCDVALLKSRLHRGRRSLAKAAGLEHLLAAGRTPPAAAARNK